jgi:hypothetical protein
MTASVSSALAPVRRLSCPYEREPLAAGDLILFQMLNFILAFFFPLSLTPWVLVETTRGIWIASILKLLGLHRHDGEPTNVGGSPGPSTIHVWRWTCSHGDRFSFREGCEPVTCRLRSQIETSRSSLKRGPLLERGDL